MRQAAVETAVGLVQRKLRADHRPARAWLMMQRADHHALGRLARVSKIGCLAILMPLASGTAEQTRCRRHRCAEDW